MSRWRVLNRNVNYFPPQMLLDSLSFSSHFFLLQHGLPCCTFPIRSGSLSIPKVDLTFILKACSYIKCCCLLPCMSRCLHALACHSDGETSYIQLHSAVHFPITFYGVVHINFILHDRFSMPSLLHDYPSLSRPKVKMAPSSIFLWSKTKWTRLF